MDGIKTAEYQRACWWSTPGKFGGRLGRKDIRDIHSIPRHAGRSTRWEFRDRAQSRGTTRHAFGCSQRGSVGAPLWHRIPVARAANMIFSAPSELYVCGERPMSQERATPRFTPVARVSDVPPGRLRRAEIGGRLILLANVAGAIYAVDDDCTHISGPLDQGELCEFTLTCPLHLARFDIRDGRVLRGPAREPLPTYAVRVEGDEICVAAPDGMGC